MAATRGPQNPKKKKFSSAIQANLLPANIQQMKDEYQALKQTFNADKANDLESTLDFFTNNRFQYLDIQKKENISDTERLEAEQLESKARMKVAEEGLRQAAQTITSAYNLEQADADILARCYIDELHQAQNLTKFNEVITRDITTAQQRGETALENSLTKIEDTFNQIQRTIDNAKDPNVSTVGKASMGKATSRLHGLQLETKKYRKKYLKLAQATKRALTSMGYADPQDALTKMKSGNQSIPFTPVDKSKFKKRETLARVKSSTKSITTDERRNAIARSLEIADQTTKQTISQLSEAGIKISGNSKQSSLEEMKDKTLVIDFETLMDQTPITVGFTTVEDGQNGAELVTEEGAYLTADIQADIKRFTTMLTDPKEMKEAQRGFAKNFLGLEEGKFDAAKQRIVYTAGGHELSEAELKDLIKHRIENKLLNGINAEQLAEEKQYQLPGTQIQIELPEYKVFNAKGIAEKTSQYKEEEIYIANKKFDWAVLDNILPDGKKLDLDKINDIFDMIFGDDNESLKYSGGYGVESLMRILNPAFDAAAEKAAHGAGYDTWLEATLVQWLKAAKKDGRDLGAEFKASEAMYEKMFEDMVGGDMYEDAIDKDGKHYKRRTQAYIDFHKLAADMVSKVIQANRDPGNNNKVSDNYDISKIYENGQFDANKLKADYQTMQQNKNAAKAAQDEVINQLQSLENRGAIRPGYVKFMKGEVTAEKMHEVNPDRSVKEFEGQAKVAQQISRITQLAANNGLMVQFDIEQDSRGVVSIIPNFIRAANYDPTKTYKKGVAGWAGSFSMRLLDEQSELVPGVKSATLISPLTHDLQDSIVAENNSKIFGMERLFKTNPELTKQDGEVITPEAIDSMIKSWAKKTSALTNAKNDDVELRTINNETGESRISSAQTKSEEEKTKELHLISWKEFINYQLSHNRALAEEYFKSIANEKGDVNIELAQLKELTEADMDTMLITFSRVANRTDEELVAYVEDMKRNIPDYDKSLQGMILADKKFAKMRADIRDTAKRAGGLHLENVSENESMAGKASNSVFNTHSVSATLDIPNEAAEKTRPDKVYGKLYEEGQEYLDKVDKAKEYFETNYTSPIDAVTQTNKEANQLVVKKGYLPQRVLEIAANKASGGAVGFTEDHGLVTEEFLGVNEGRGIDKFSGELTEEGMNLMVGLTGQKDLFEGEVDKWVPLQESHVVTNGPLQIGDTIIPEGGVIIATRINQNGKGEVQYRQSGEARPDDKYTGDNARKQYQTTGAKTIDELRAQLKEAVEQYLKEEFGTYEEYKQKNPNATAKEFIAKKRQLKKALTGIINRNVMFETATEEDDKVGSPRSSAEDAIPILRALIGNPNEIVPGGSNQTRFEFLQSKDEIFNKLFEVKDGQVVNKYAHDLSDYNVTNEDREMFINYDIAASQLSDILSYDFKTGKATYKETDDAKIAQKSGNAFKSLEEVKAYVAEHYDTIKERDDKVKMFLNGYVKSTNMDWGLISNLIKSITDDEVEQAILLASGLGIVNSQKDYAFAKGQGAEGTAGEAMDGKINEHAAVKSQLALLEREYERMQSQRKIAIDYLTSRNYSEAEANAKFDEIVQAHLQNITTINKRRAEEYSVLDIAALSNDPRHRGEVQHLRTVTISFDRPTGGDVVNFYDLLNKEQSSHPENGQSFTQSEYAESMFPILYGEDRGKIIGDSNVRIQFDFSSLDENSDEYKRLKAAGVEDHMFVALEREFNEEGKNKTRTLGQQQRNFGKKIKKVNEIMEGTYTPTATSDADGKRVTWGDVWKNDIVQDTKAKKKGIFDRPQQSSILHSGIAGERWDYSWINEKTARYNLKYKEDGDKKDFINYIMSFKDNASDVFDTFAQSKLGLKESDFNTREDYIKEVRNKLKQTRLPKLKQYADKNIYEVLLKDMKFDYLYSSTFTSKKDSRDYINFYKGNKKFAGVFKSWADKYFDGEVTDEKLKAKTPKELQELVFKLSQGIIAKKFHTLGSRGPFLTEYSNSLDEISINFDDTQHDDVINMTEEDYVNWKADWDGDILNLTRLREQADEETQAIIDLMIADRKEMLRRAVKLEKRIKDKKKKSKRAKFMDMIDAYSKNDAFKVGYQAWFDSLSEENKKAWKARELDKFSQEDLNDINKKINPKYQKTNLMHGWMSNASLLTNKDAAISLYSMILGGKREVGLANYDDSQLRGAFAYRIKNDKHVSLSEILGMRLYAEMNTQLGQQTGISTKKFIEALNNEDNWKTGRFALDSTTAGDIFNAMKQDGTAQKYGIQAPEDIVNKWQPILAGSMFSHFSVNHLQEARDKAEQLKAEGKTSEANKLLKEVDKLEEIFVNEDVMGFINWLNTKGGMQKTFKYIGEHREEVDKFKDTRFADLLHIFGLTPPGELTVDAETAIQDKFDKGKTKGKGDGEDNCCFKMFEPYLKEYDYWLKALFDRLNTIANNGGAGGGNGKEVYGTNILWDEFWKESQEELHGDKEKGTQPTASIEIASFKTKLKDENIDADTGLPQHDYDSPNGKKAQVSASELGPAILGLPKDAVLDEQSKMINRSLYAGWAKFQNNKAVFNQDLGTVLEQEGQNDVYDLSQIPRLDIDKIDEEGTINNQALNLIASSIAGNLFHAAHASVITAIKKGDIGSLTEAIGNENGITESIFTQGDNEYAKKYREQYLLLFRLLGGNQERVNAVLRRYGKGTEDLIEALKLEQKDGMFEHGENVEVEQSYGAHVGYKDENGKEIFGKDLVATLDTVNIHGIKSDKDTVDWDSDDWYQDISVVSTDLKRKLANGHISADDALEGAQQHLVLWATIAQNEEEWKQKILKAYKAQYQNFDEDKFNAEWSDIYNKLLENTKAETTQFLEAKNGEVALIQGSAVDQDRGEALPTDPEKLAEYIVTALRFAKDNEEKGIGNKGINIKGVSNIEDKNGELYGIKDYETALEGRIKREKELMGLEELKDQLLLSNSPEAEQQLADVNDQINRLEEKLAKYDQVVEEMWQNPGQLTQEQLEDYKGHIVSFDAKRFVNKKNPEGMNSGLYGGMYGNGGGMYGGSGMSGMSGMSGVSGGFYQITNAARGALSSIMGFTAANKVLSEVTKSIKTVISAAEQLDKKLVDLQIATGNTKSETIDMLQGYNQLATELGRTTASVADAANDWLRAGYEGQEATDLITASMYLSTLGMMDAATATKDLISVLKGWKLQSDEVMGVVDKLVTGTNNSVCLVIGTGHKFNCR